MNPHVHAAPGIQRAELVLSGLSCPACVRAVEEAVRALPGVETASVNLATAHAFVDYEPGRTSLVVIHDAIKKAGYRVGVGRAIPDQGDHVRLVRYSHRGSPQGHARGDPRHRERRHGGGRGRVRSRCN